MFDLTFALNKKILAGFLITHTKQPYFLMVQNIYRTCDHPDQQVFIAHKAGYREKQDAKVWKINEQLFI